MPDGMQRGRLIRAGRREPRHKGGAISTKLTTDESARAALVELCTGLIDFPDLGDGEVVGAEAVPEPFRHLLVHHEHMTTRLGAFHGKPMALHVLKHIIDGDTYRRLITLHADGEACPTEVGLVRIDLGCTAPAVRAMILDETQPLGDILISHNVMRRIEPLWYWRFEGPGLAARHFGPGLTPYYGRLGVIHCDNRPAIRLLEIVRGSPRRGSRPA